MSNETCKICCRDVSNPYRRYADGRIVEGCISKAHNGQLPGTSNTSAWHNRKEAKAWRKQTGL